MFRAWYAFAKQGFRQQAAYKVEGVLGLASSLIWFVLYAGIWTALLRDDPAALQRQVGYVIAARILSELNFIPTWEVSFLFRQGDVGLTLIRPVSLPVRFLADFLGRSVFRLFRSLPFFILFWWLFDLPTPSVPQVLLFAASACLSWIIVSTLLMSLALIALWTVQFNEAEQIFELCVSLLSGAFIPLYFLPGWVANIAQYLPFAGMYFTPSAILSGGLAGTALAQAMAIQAMWAIVGVAVVTAMWNAGSRKMVMQGG